MEIKLSVEQVIKEHQDRGYFFRVDGVKSFALDEGKGEAVLCLHGVPTSSFLYRKVICALSAQGVRGIAIDLPGLGLADRPESFNYTFSNFARFCARAADVIGLNKFHLLVHDIGGPIGFAVAAQLKHRIQSITILNSFIDVDTFKKPLPMRPFEKPVLGEAELALITHYTWYAGFTTMAVSDTEGIPKEEIYAYVDLLKWDDGGKAFLQIMRNFPTSREFTNTCYSAVQNVPYPVQAIWGADDPGLRYDEHGLAIKRAASLPEIYQLPAKHLLQEDQWQAIADKIVHISARRR